MYVYMLKRVLIQIDKTLNVPVHNYSLMVNVDGKNLTIQDVAHVSINQEQVSISEDGMHRIVTSRSNLEKILSSKSTVYGINTGFGSLMDKRISDSDLSNLQLNLIRSHSSGAGEPLSQEYVRGMMLIRCNSLSRGFSGITPELIQHLVNMLNHDIIPIVPRYGSLGASGDLAPLAHVGLAMIGESPVLKDGVQTDGLSALRDVGLAPYKFREKEGIALINGTAASSSIAAISIFRASRIIDAATAAAALSIQGLGGTPKAFAEWVVSTRPHKGQILVAASLRTMLDGYKPEKERVQDAYTLRCIPQVYGAVRDTLSYVAGIVETEINSATDNPLLNEEEAISAGNFHGEPVALASDFLSIALTDLGNMIERRIFRLTSSPLSGLPPFLVENSGLNSGYMIPQYTAAALCNMNKTLSHPASADSIPSSADQEDHVSMAMNAALKLTEVVKNLADIVAIEILTACQAVDFCHNTISPRIRLLHEEIRKLVPHLDRDRPIAEDVKKISSLILSDKFASLVQKIVS